jgi:hypothetical protein
MTFTWSFETDNREGFTWHFYTGPQGNITPGRRCHRGPMIDVESVMAVPYGLMAKYSTLRKRLLDHVVNSIEPPVQTREVVLRTLNSQYGPIFARLTPQAPLLEVDICEKRNSLDIEADLVALNPFYREAARSLSEYRVPVQHLAQLDTALTSNSPILRVAGKCATILLISYIELDSMNG